MKTCPKCNIEHIKPGTYCSRTCANSRTWSEEINAKRSAKMAGKPSTRVIADMDKWRTNRKLSALAKYNATPFDELGSENRRRRVFEEQNHCCNKCKTEYWQGVKIPLELEHKDGNNQNNVRENLEGLCPNCHSITDTWRGRNKPTRNGINKVSDSELLESLQTTDSIRQALLKVGLSAKGNNYDRAKKLLNPDHIKTHLQPIGSEKSVGSVFQYGTR
jgi:5-methylcytosine-specific restriction endonuclease McrA